MRKQSASRDCKAEWNTTTLGAEIDLLVGFAFKSAQYTNASDAMRLLRGDNIIQGCLRWDDVKKWPADDTDGYKQYRLCEGDIVLAMDRPWVKSGLKHAMISDADLPCLLVQRTASLRAGTHLDSRFLMYLIGSGTFARHILGVQTGIGVPHISGQQIKEFEFARPPLAEQRRIVGILNEAFEGIATAKANAEKNLQNARALFESHLQAVFTQRCGGWVEKCLGEVFTTVTGNTPPKNNADFYGDFIPLVKPPELCDSTVDSAADGLSEVGAAVARTLPPKSILVSCIGNLGKIGLNIVPVAFNQQINAILPDESKAIPEFMFFQVLSSSFKEQLEAMASGTTVPIVNKSKFNSVTIVLPPLAIQKAIVAQSELLREETQRLESLYRRKLAALDELKKSLLHQAFSGELTKDN